MPSGNFKIKKFLLFHAHQHRVFSILLVRIKCSRALYKKNTSLESKIHVATTLNAVSRLFLAKNKNQASLVLLQKRHHTKTKFDSPACQCMFHFYFHMQSSSSFYRFRLCCQELELGASENLLLVIVDQRKLLLEGLNLVLTLPALKAFYLFLVHCKLVELKESRNFLQLWYLVLCLVALVILEQKIHLLASLFLLEK